MCTVTFVARASGYLLGMNRDEQRSRPPGLAPHEWIARGRRVLGPSEEGGGMWCGVNDAGAAFALVNWYSVPRRVGARAHSRGQVTRLALETESPAQVEAALNTLPLDRVNPFRLIGVFPGEQDVVEWRWDLRELRRFRCGWVTQAWFSSGHDEEGAQESRGACLATALRHKDAGDVAWLRRLHRSHQPGCGPYSICMHRPDAVTVSHTEIVGGNSCATLRHIQGSPCSPRSQSVDRMALHTGPTIVAYHHR